jgi:hypothetical protein
VAHQQPELPEIANEFFEQLVLAHILKADDPEGFSNIRALLSDACFTKPAHRVIWQAMCTVYDAGSRIGPHLVYLHASKNGHKEITPSFLADLTSGSPIIGDLGPYCTELLDCETLRRLYVANAEVNSRIASRQGTTSEIVRDIERTLANLGRKFRQSNEVRPSAIVERAGGVQDFTTPSTVGSIQFPGLDFRLSPGASPKAGVCDWGNAKHGQNNHCPQHHRSLHFQFGQAGSLGATGIGERRDPVSDGL